MLTLLDEGMEATDNEDVVCAGAAFILILTGVSRCRDRHYLTRASLPLQNSCAWKLVKEYNVDDMAWLEFTCLTRPGFIGLLRQFAPAMKRFWNEAAQPVRGRGARTGKPGGRPRSMTACDVLGLVLHYLHSTSSSSVRCQLFGISPAVQCRALCDGMHVLLLVLKVFKVSRIRWPTAADMKASADRIHASQPMLTREYILPLMICMYILPSSMCARRVRTLVGILTCDLLSDIFGFVDGLNLAMQEPAHPLVQNAYYNGWLSGCFSSNLFVFDSFGIIVYAYINAPGTQHDSTLACGLYDILRHKVPEPFIPIICKPGR